MSTVKGINDMTPLERLALWRDLNAIRGQDINAARDEGHTWADITTASGLARQTVTNLAEKARREEAG